MPNFHAWLDEVRPSPYADQLSLGFRGLRFSRALEREYRAHLLDDSFELKRFALSVAMVIWLALAVLDLLVVPASHLAWVLGVRFVVLVILLVCAALILQRRHTHLLLPLSMACILTLGVGAALIVGIVHQVDPGYPYEGLLLVSMAAYFLVGLRLSEALACSLVVLTAYVVAELLAGLPAARLINNVLFLAFGNLTGAVGCYLLEYKSREHFLVSRLMRLLAYHDSLTGLHNRRSFNRQFERLWRQAQRDGKPLALLLCDIDHFKAYNDCYGHQAGDAALQRVGMLIEQAARRPLDMGVRLGGEEFALLLFDIAADEARQRAEALRQSLEAAAIVHRGSDSAEVLTMSIGVACLTPGVQAELGQLYEQADRALYEAKAFGRNQVAA
ncbi:Phytochrome-like protein cph2 [Pseudomonas sp. THAF187a]|uniref:GGDEF domain-containing protein n=1 Tax=unclassified Pseudomonas TaxID=196821 RepID=UPI0012695213|nr:MULTISPECIES: GGDEF domain-containing protein [unclassified Pseudomonas]QFT21788.1 Phytochrome-like protein cph2 [Pseudomonas sp. THAF187a]QFT41975.1 Phytochrome-like protein cph2 [Pseudomonas sp. THAF42]